MTQDDIIELNSVDPYTGLTYADRVIQDGILSQWQDVYSKADSTDYRAMQREMSSRYDWHNGETRRERDARILRAALGEPL